MITKEPPEQESVTESTKTRSPGWLQALPAVQNYRGNKEVCLPIWEGGVERKGESQQFNIWIEQRNFFPPRILPGGTLTYTKSERRQSCPGENDKVTRGIGEIISVKHSDSMRSNDASCSHFRGGKSISSPGRSLLFKVPL